MEQRKSFIFYKDWFDAISHLDSNLQLELYNAIMKKAFFNELPYLSELGTLAMSFIEPQIERDTDKWLEIKKKRQQSGKQGGLAKQANATKCYQMLPNSSKSKQNVANVAVNVNDNVNVNVDNNNVILKEKEDNNISSKKQTRFVKPTVEQVSAYVVEKNYHVDAENFVNYYESKGWVVGKSPMKDWKAAVRTWEKTWKDNHPQEVQTTLSSSIQNNNEDIVVNGQIYR